MLNKKARSKPKPSRSMEPTDPAQKEKSSLSADSLHTSKTGGTYDCSRKTS